MKRSLLALALTIGFCLPALAQEVPPTPPDNGGEPGMHHRMDGDKGGWGHEGHEGKGGWGGHEGHEGKGGWGHGEHREGGRHHGHHGREGGMRGPHLSEEQTMTFLRANYPEKAAELDAAKTKEPEKYRHEVMGAGRMVGHLQMMQKHDPAGFQSALAEMKGNDQVHRLMHAYHEAPAGGKAAIKAQLRTAVDGLFEAREQNHRHRLEHMREMLGKMETHLKDREAKRAAIVDKHVNDLTTSGEDRW